MVVQVTMRPVMTRQHLRFVLPAVKEVRVRAVLIFAPMTAFKKDVWQRGEGSFWLLLGFEILPRTYERGVGPFD